MNTIFYNGKCFSQDNSYPYCSALAVKNDVIIAMGNDDEILSLTTPKTYIIDLQGRLILPGFIDSHVHLLFYAHQANLINLSNVNNFSQAKNLISKKIPWAEKNGQWLQGIGFNQYFWYDKIMPTRKDLDSISTAIPITIRRACYHISVCNTKALEIIGLIDENKNDTKFNMGFYADGSPNGIIKEESQELISKALPPQSIEEIEEMIIRGCNDAASCGITELQSDDFMMIPGDNGESIMNIYKKLSLNNQLPIRIYQQCLLWEKNNLLSFLKKGHMTGDDFGLYRIGPLKLISDGSLGAHTAYMKEPYENDPYTCGVLNYTDEELYSICKLAHNAGMQIAIHSIGNGSLEQVLKTYRIIQLENPRTNCRHGVVHCQIMDSKQQDSFKKQTILAYVQPVFIRSDMDIVDDCVGKKLGASSYNWRRFEDLGVHQICSSDCPVESFNILSNIEYAVTRTDFETNRCWHPENAVTLEEAIKMFTIEGAYASFSENIRGTLTVGKKADLVILSKDIFEIPANEIHTTMVDLTMVNGKTVYTRQNQ